MLQTVKALRSWVSESLGLPDEAVQDMKDLADALNAPNEATDKVPNIGT